MSDPENLIFLNSKLFLNDNSLICLFLKLCPTSC